MRYFNQQPRVRTAAIVAMTMLVFAGCSGRNSFDISNLNPLPKKKKNLQSIAKIVCIWKAAEGRDMKNRPARGLAGKVLFFAPGRSGVPVKLDGDGKVLVYVFDDQGTRAEKAKPIHKFEFPLNVWNLHYRDSDLGPSYDVFIPYTRNVIHQVKMTAHVRLVPEGGRGVAMSDLDSVTLPGPQRQQDKEALVHSITPKSSNARTRVTTVSQNSPRSRTFDLGRSDDEGRARVQNRVQQAGAVGDKSPMPRGELTRRFEQAVKEGKVDLPGNRKFAPATGVIHRESRQIKPKVVTAGSPQNKSYRLSHASRSETAGRRSPVRDFAKSNPRRPDTGVRQAVESLPSPFAGDGSFTPPAGNDPRHASHTIASPNRVTKAHPLLGGDEKPRRRSTSGNGVLDIHGHPLHESDVPRRKYSTPEYPLNEPVQRTQTRSLIDRPSAKALLEDGPDAR